MNGVRIFEVGPRDGLQNESALIPFDVKFKFIEMLIEAGLKDIEAGAFVSATAVPQMADSASLLKKLIKKYPRTNFHALVPNLFGLKQALKCGVKHIGLLTSCSEEFNKRNLNTSTIGSIERINDILEYCSEDIYKRLYISMTFHSPWEGEIREEQFTNLLQEVKNLAVNEIVLSDTTGFATAENVEEKISLALSLFPIEKLACHFHDTKAQAIANIERALKCGIRTIDSSTGGLGGCPYSPGATGNISTEKAIECIKKSGFDSSISLERIQEAANYICEHLENNLARD